MTFPEQARDPKLAGLKVEFEIEILEIKNRVVPEIDEQFAREIRPDLTPEAIKQEVIDAVNADAEERTKANRNRALEEALLAISTWGCCCCVGGWVEGWDIKAHEGWDDCAGFKGTACESASTNRPITHPTTTPTAEAEVPECWILDETRRKFALMMQEMSSQGTYVCMSTSIDHVMPVHPLHPLTHPSNHPTPPPSQQASQRRR